MALKNIVICLILVIAALQSNTLCFAEEPITADILKEAATLKKAGQTQQSLELLKSHIKKHPGAIAAKVELVLTYYELGNFKAGDSLLDDVLTGSKIPKTTKSEISKLAGKIRRKHLISTIESLFKSAESARDSGQFYASRRSYNEILMLTPNNTKAQIGLAISEYRIGNLSRSEQLFSTLEKQDLSNNRRKTVSSYLARIEKRGTIKSSFSGRLLAAIGYDDNVEGSLTIDVLDEPELIGEQIIADNYWKLSASLGHRYRFDRSVNYQDRPISLSWRSRFSMTEKRYFDKSNEDENTRILSARTGASINNPKHWRGRLYGSIRNIVLDGESLLTYYGAAPSFTWINRYYEITLGSDFRYRQYDSSSREPRNGLRTDLSVDYDLFPLGNRKLRLNAEIGVSRQSTKSDDSRAYNRFSAAGGIYWRPIKGSLLYSNISLKLYEYQAVDESLLNDEDDPVFDFVREDDRTTFNLGGNYTFSNGVQIRTSASYLNNQSNQLLYDYDRFTAEVGLAYTF